MCAMLMFAFGNAWAQSPAYEGQVESKSLHTPWTETDASGEVRINLFVFWSKHCPHCLESLPFLDSLAERKPWLNIHTLELTQHPEHVDLYVRMAAALGQDARSVPAFLYCGIMEVGFRDADTTGAKLEAELVRCREQNQAGVEPQQTPSTPADTRITVPLYGALNVESLSLPVLTLVLAGLDSFNPCAFFVLLFLMSLMVHARSRARMFVIGGIFVLFSGLIYFLFMSAWLNLFMIMGQVKWMTLSAGVLAIALATINIKDFFWFKRGPSLSISESAKPKLFTHMRGLLSADNISAMIIGTIILAIAANSYELLCTAGFPMIYTRVLTMEALPTSSYYLYLLLYNLIYVVPLLTIVIVFVLTMGTRRLKEQEGRILKLMSGVMMLGLGLLLVIAPELMNNVLVALALLGLALSVTWVLSRVYRDQRVNT